MPVTIKLLEQIRSESGSDTVVVVACDKATNKVHSWRAGDEPEQLLAIDKYLAETCRPYLEAIELMQDLLKSKLFPQGGADKIRKFLETASTKDFRNTDALLEELAADLARANADCVGAYKMIAELHAAAVGEVRGPAKGVVEDVAEVRAELLAARDKIAKAHAIADLLS